MKPATIEKLKTLANRDTRMDFNGDFNAYDDSGGNFDDAFSMGVDDGKTYLAREILEDLGIDWTK